MQVEQNGHDLAMKNLLLYRNGLNLRSINEDRYRNMNKKAIGGDPSMWMSARVPEAHVIYTCYRCTPKERPALLQAYLRSISLLNPTCNTEPMANYHLLQSKEHNDEDEETGNGTPSPAGTESDESKLWKYIAIFLAVCAITVMSFIAGCRFSSRLVFNGAAFTEDLSFLSRYVPRGSSICVKS